MFNSFEDICEGFKEYMQLNSKDSKGTLEQYFPKVRDTLVKYLEDSYKGKENLYCIDDFLKEVTVSDIAESAVKDIQRVYNAKGSVSQTAINNYIIAFRQFFDYLTNVGVENSRIMVFFSRNPKRNDGMKNLRKKIEDELKILNIPLEKIKRDPPLAANEDDDKFKFLINEINGVDENWESLDLMKDHSLYKLQYIIMVKLFLLFGLKPNRLYCIKVGDYDKKHCQLHIHDTDYRLQVPNLLSDQLAQLKEFKTSQGYADNDYLLTTNDGAPVDEGHLPYYLNKIKKAFIKYYGLSAMEYRHGNNPFTQTGLLKYGIIQMIRQGMSPAVVREVTGIDVDIYEDCQEIALEDMMDKSRYFNANIRSISTYDFFNEKCLIQFTASSEL